MQLDSSRWGWPVYYAFLYLINVNFFLDSLLIAVEARDSDRGRYFLNTHTPYEIHPGDC
jgi:hypothetical protein